MRVVIYQLELAEKIVYNLGQLLEKLCLSGKKIGVLCETSKLEEIDKYLWTFSTNYFIPHDIVCDDKEYNDNQNVLLTDNINDITERDIVCVFDNDSLKKIASVIDTGVKTISDIIYMTKADVVEGVKNILPIANVDLFKKIKGKWEKSMFWYDEKHKKVFYS